MTQRRRLSQNKKIRPSFWVFCEGETEKYYINYLKLKYRQSIEIITKIAGNEINEKYIKSYKKDKPTHEKDITFLIYDADVINIVEKLLKIKHSTLILSNPSIEFWFLLHFKNQKAEISTKDCIKELTNRNKNHYKKGEIDNNLKKKFEEKQTEAIKFAKTLEHFKNPSSNFYIFIEKLLYEK